MAFDLPWCAGRSYVDVPLGGAQGDPPARPARAFPGALRGPRCARRRRVLRGRGGPGPRGRHGQAPPEPLRGGPPLVGVAQAQGPADPGADRGRIRPGPGEPPRPRRARRRRDGGRPAPVRRARGQRPRRRDAGAPPGGARRAVAARPPVRRRAARSRRHRGRDVGHPGSRDPGRDRGLVAGRDRAPGNVRPGGAGSRSGVRRTPGGSRSRGCRPRPGEGRRGPGVRRARGHTSCEQAEWFASVEG